MRPAALALAVGIVAGACSSNAGPPGVNPPDAMPDARPAWLADEKILVPGVGVTEMECRTKVCPHNENTDLINFQGAIYLVHRTAMSQVLGPNSSLRVYKSTDGGASFDLLAVLPAPENRDLRDPHFYVVNGNLTIKALTRKPINSIRDSNVDTIAVSMTSIDGGVTWTPIVEAVLMAPPTWSLWRIRERDGVYYSAAYEDGDKSVVLYRSGDGVTWTAGAPIYTIAEDTPLETELVFMPSGRLLALVRMDGTDEELLGATGRLRTKICWAMPPYDQFDCPQEFDDQRLDGPLAFFHGDRLFVVARKHLRVHNRKRTSLFEIGGTLEGGPLTIRELGELPSAGDTSYAGIADLDGDRKVVTWYSSELRRDEQWVIAVFQPSDIWQATIDFSKL